MLLFLGIRRAPKGPYISGNRQSDSSKECENANFSPANVLCALELQKASEQIRNERIKEKII